MSRKSRAKSMYMRVFRLAFPQREKVTQARYRNSAAYRAARALYRQSGKNREYARRYRQTEYGKIQKQQGCALRRARHRHATLPGTRRAIKKIYKRAQELRQWFDVEVDHIFPLGFGWHEPANLQIIYAHENRAKRENPDYRPSVIFS